VSEGRVKSGATRPTATTGPDWPDPEPDPEWWPSPTNKKTANTAATTEPIRKDRSRRGGRGGWGRSGTSAPAGVSGGGGGPVGSEVAGTPAAPINAW
jgi:uncharacterized membrane protein YgcG